MDKAKAAIKDFTSRAGHHDTTVHETVAPAVQKEVIKPHKHEEVMTAVDKEVHQDHYHRTVQPIQDREVLPEKHHHNLAAVEHREIDHRDHDTTKRALAAEQQQFRDERIVTDTTHSQAVGGTIGGEHVHHHIHETIQPVVHKEVIQPSVVHTTVPIHETHHNAAKHHNTSELPPVSMSEFKNKGGVLGGREERYDGFEGEPKHIGGIAHDKRDSGLGATGLATAGAGAGLAGAGRHHHKRTNSNSSYSSSDEEKGTHRRSTRGTARNTTGKPSMMDKLNPKVDANGDGKAGFMK